VYVWKTRVSFSALCRAFFQSSSGKQICTSRREKLWDRFRVRRDPGPIAKVTRRTTSRLARIFRCLASG
jgi:hypothetical protein